MFNGEFFIEILECFAPFQEMCYLSAVIWRLYKNNA